jgi:hypothetical protein
MAVNYCLAVYSPADRLAVNLRTEPSDEQYRRYIQPGSLVYYLPLLIIRNGMPSEVRRACVLPVPT